MSKTTKQQVSLKFKYFQLCGDYIITSPSHMVAVVVDIDDSSFQDGFSKEFEELGFLNRACS